MDVGHRVLRGSFVGYRTLVPRAPASFPPSLLCGCWAQLLGLVKQQDRPGWEKGELREFN